MMKELTFRFRDLVIDRAGMESVMGFPGGCPEPFKTWLDEVLRFAEDLPDIRAAYLIVDEIDLSRSGASLFAGGVELRVGKTIKKEIMGSALIAFFICTAGARICAKAKELMGGEDAALGYLYDMAGSFIAEAAADYMQQILARELTASGQKITNRYSPGYCQWPVSGQQALFSFFQGRTCGVTLTPSSLMVPAKSVSGLIGIGKDVHYREYQCDLCSMKNCTYRKVKSV